MRNFARSASNPVSADQPTAKLPKLAKAKFDGVFAEGSQLNAPQVEELLMDYQRLVNYLKGISAFEE